MKVYKFLLAISLAFLFSLSSNVHAQISVNQESMSLGSKAAFVVDLSGADKKLTEKKWKDLIKDYGKIEKNKKAKEQSVLQANLPGFESAVNVFFKAEEGKDLTRVYFFFDNGSKFVDEADEDSGPAKVFINDFIVEVNKEVAKRELEQGEDELKGFEKDLSKLEKKNKKLHDDIEKFKKKIAEAEADIQENLKQQDSSKENIEAQKSKVEELKNAYNNIGKG